MNPSEIARRLRAMADEIERTVDLGAPAERKADRMADLLARGIAFRPKANPAPPAPPAADAEVHEVGYWEVRTTAKGNIMASLGVTIDGEKVYWKCFEADVIAKVDPLKRGDRVALKTIPWNDTRKIVSIEIVPGGRFVPAKPAKGMASEEIPF